MRTDSPQHPPLLVAMLLFVSGACALSYQVAWLRLLRLIFGHSTAASAAVLAIFMAGLGVGAVILGRRADPHPHPLRWYGWLELGIALSAATTPFLVDVVRWAYIATAGAHGDGLAYLTALRLGLAAAVLGLPTFFMGGTLSAAARATEISHAHRQRTALLYASNTLGAVTGALIANFILLEVLGTRRTIWAAAAVNGVLAAMVLLLPRADRRQHTHRSADMPAHDPGPVAGATFLLWVAGIAGCGFLLMELVWYRALAPLLGGSTYTFGIILAVALFGIGVGSLTYSIEPARPSRLRLGRLALVSVVEGLCAIIPFALGDRIALLAMALQPLNVAGFGSQVLVWTSIAAVVVFPMACLSGYQFALVLGLIGSRADVVGKQVGYAYGCNTAGAIAGSLAGGFGLVPLLGAVGTWRAVVLVLVGLGLAAMWLARRRREPPGLLVATVAIAGITLSLCGTVGPTAVWRHTPIGAGLARSFGATPNDLRAYMHDVRRSVVWERDGVESSVALTDTNAFSLIMNGKSDGNAVTDASTMIMTGMLPALFHDHPRRALVIGLGLGATAGWLARVPTVERVDVIELEPAVEQAARDAAAVSFDVLSNPKVRLVIGDARERLLTTRERYDLIVSEPSNPYRAGVASLFTREYYEAVQRALADGGIFAQWVQAYAVNAATMRTIYATLATAFPAVESWEVQLGSDLLLLARARPLHHDVERLRTRIAAEPFASAFAVGWGVGGVEGLYTGFVAGPALAQTVRDTTPAHRLNLDDRTVIEFELARSLGLPDPQLLRLIRDQAAREATFAPALENGGLDWMVVSELRAARALHEEKPFTLDGFPGGSAALERMRARAAYAAGQLAEVATAWDRQDSAPVQPIDQIMLAEAWADRGDRRCPALAELVGQHSEADGEAILASYHAHRGDNDAAIQHLARAFHAWRSSPWGYRPLLQRSLNLAWQLAASLPSSVDPLLAALRDPFAVHVLEDRRAFAYAAIAIHFGPPQLCAAALEPVEPWILWDLPFLEKRAGCYTRLGSPLAAPARADVLNFRQAAPASFLRPNG